MRNYVKMMKCSNTFCINCNYCIYKNTFSFTNAILSFLGPSIHVFKYSHRSATFVCRSIPDLISYFSSQVIMATNRADTLDPALLRPGRLDRKIEFPMPDRRQKRLIFSTITGKMNLSDEVDLEDYIARPDKISGADINAICQEVRKVFYHFILNGRQVYLLRSSLENARCLIFSRGTEALV